MSEVHSPALESSVPAYIRRTERLTFASTADGYLIPIAVTFFAYFIAGRLGQATGSIRSSNLGPVWPAFGIALAAVLGYGRRVWPGLYVSAFLVAIEGGVSAAAALGQAGGATLGAVAGAALLGRFPNFDPTLSRLRDALALIVLGAFGGAVVSSLLGIGALYATGVTPYRGLLSAWVIYWLGDATGVLLITPLAFTLPRLLHAPTRARRIALAALFALLTIACFIIFGDSLLLPIRLHVLAFAVLPFVMWGAIQFGIEGASLSVVWIATLATVLTALGHGPFSLSTTFVNAAMLDVLFIVLSVSGLCLAAVVAEREGMAPRLQLAAIIESSEDAIWSQDLDGRIVSWNSAAERIFGFTAAEAIGRPNGILYPPDVRAEEDELFGRLRAGEHVVHRLTRRMAKNGESIHVALTVAPLRDPSGTLVGLAKIARDITEQQRSRDALRAANRRLIDAQEQERARIARELHDDIGQRLTLLITDLGSESNAVQNKIGKLRRNASEIAADIQALSHSLHSKKLEYLGMARTFRVTCEEFARQHKMTVAFEAHDVPANVPAEASLCLYRILQEAMRNTARHSGATHMHVLLTGYPGEVELIVRDDGNGFDVKEDAGGRGIGLLTMRERIALAAGELSVDSASGQGTTIRARVPVANA